MVDESKNKPKHSNVNRLRWLRQYHLLCLSRLINLGLGMPEHDKDSRLKFSALFHLRELRVIEAQKWGGYLSSGELRAEAIPLVLDEGIVLSDTIPDGRLDIYQTTNLDDDGE